MGKSKKKRRKKVAHKVDKWVDESGLSERELILAGLGVMARAVEDGKRKILKNAIRRGKKIAEVGVPSLDRSERMDQTQGRSDADSAASKTSENAPSAKNDKAKNAKKGKKQKASGKTKKNVNGGKSSKSTRKSTTTSQQDSPSSPVAEPVIAYRPRGGGWYNIDVGSVLVDKVKGEELAAARAAELLTAYAARPADEQRKAETGMTHAGGGWYDITVAGVPVDRIRGKDAAIERFPLIEAG